MSRTRSFPHRIYRTFLILYLYLANARNNTRVIVSNSPPDAARRKPHLMHEFSEAKICFVPWRGAAGRGVSVGNTRPVLSGQIAISRVAFRVVAPPSPPLRPPRRATSPAILLTIEYDRAIYSLAFPRIIIRSNKFATR